MQLCSSFPFIVISVFFVLQLFLYSHLVADFLSLHVYCFLYLQFLYLLAFPSLLPFFYVQKLTGPYFYEVAALSC